jgi:hypothetical protein
MGTFHEVAWMSDEGLDVGVEVGFLSSFHRYWELLMCLLLTLRGPLARCIISYDYHVECCLSLIVSTPRRIPG